MRSKGSLDLSAIDVINQDAWRAASAQTYFDERAAWLDEGERRIFDTLEPEIADWAVLDLGVGTGRTTRLFAPVSRAYVAIDYLPEMVEIMHDRFPEIRTEEGDARDLGRFVDASFGLVVFSYNGIDAVAHEDRPLIFQEALRVLEPGGVFWYSTHNRGHRSVGRAPWNPREQVLAQPGPPSSWPRAVAGVREGLLAEAVSQCGGSRVVDGHERRPRVRARHPSR